MRFYGTAQCPDCVSAVEQLKNRDISYEYADIMESIADLKAFLKLRDSRAEFEEIKKEGSIGIPCFVEDDGSIRFQI